METTHATCPDCYRPFAVDDKKVPNLPEAILWKCPACAVMLVVWRQDAVLRASRIKPHDGVPRSPS